MKTPDLKPLFAKIAQASPVMAPLSCHNPKDAMKIVIKGRMNFGKVNEPCSIFLMWPAHAVKFKEIYASKSLRYRSHSHMLAWGHTGAGAKQLALAICIELYGVAQGMEVYETFCLKYIAPLPDGDFTKEMIVEL